MNANLLRVLDQQAHTLPRATNWLEYPLFLFTRYPRLQPRVIRGNRNRYIRSHVETGRETFNRQLAAWEARIADHELARRALGELGRSQRRQLAALLCDSVVELEEHCSQANKRTYLGKLEKGTHQKKVERRFGDANKSLQALYKLALTQPPEMGGEDFQIAAVDAQNALARHRGPEFLRKRKKTVRELLASKPSSKDPTSGLMVELYSFFRDGCRLSGDEAEVRVALLRNAFWTDVGVPTINYHPHYETGESKGCSAVHEAVRRWRSGRGISG